MATVVPALRLVTAIPYERMNLLFVGINGNVLAIDHASGEEVWRVKLKGDFVNLSFEGDSLFAAAQGELYCLDPSTGHIRWNNPLKGLGWGIVTFGTADNNQAATHHKHDQDAAAATAAHNTAG
jgi:outer membrane protein assembly factor BamB